MCLLLIAQDYDNQYGLLQSKITDAGIPYTVCGNSEIELRINIIRHQPKVVLLNISKLGTEPFSALYTMVSEQKSFVEFINIYTYEDPAQLMKLSQFGTVHNYRIPLDTDMLIRYVHHICDDAPLDTDELIGMIAQKLREFLMRINPSRRQRGSDYIIEAVLTVLFGDALNINLSGEVYPHIAEKFSTTAASVEHSIRVSIRTSWDSDNRPLVEACIGGQSGRCPTNSEFITALARLIIRDNSRYLDMYRIKTMNNTYNKLHI